MSDRGWYLLQSKSESSPRFLWDVQGLVVPNTKANARLGQSPGEHGTPWELFGLDGGAVDSLVPWSMKWELQQRPLT